MRTLWLIAALLATAVVACDHYTVNVYLREFNDANKYNTEQLALVYAARDCVDFARDTQTVAKNQSEEIKDLRGQVTRAAKLVDSLRAELARTVDTLEKSGEMIKELTDENSRLNNAAGSLIDELYKETQKRITANQTIETLKDTIKSLENKVKELEKRIKGLNNDIEQYKVTIEKLFNECMDQKCVIEKKDGVISELMNEVLN